MSNLTIVRLHILHRWAIGGYTECDVWYYPFFIASIVLYFKYSSPNFLKSASPTNQPLWAMKQFWEFSLAYIFSIKRQTQQHDIPIYLLPTTQYPYKISQRQIAVSYWQPMAPLDVGLWVCTNDRKSVLNTLAQDVTVFEYGIRCWRLSQRFASVS